jgi:hypothetical protein
MDEATWLACTNPDMMQDYLRGRASNRKLRLFAVACVRRVWQKLTDERGRQAVQAAELYADGLLDEEGLRAARSVASASLRRPHGAARAAQATTRDSAWAAAREAQHETIQQVWENAQAAWQTAKLVKREAQQTHCDLFRCIFGNPFRPLRRRKFPAAVAGLARSCYEGFPSVSRDYNILADALGDLEEDWAAAHCREPLHVKGCHVVDWILGKE